MGDVRRCLGCGITYPPQEPSCPKCGSHAGELEQTPPAELKPKPKRKT